MPNEEESVIYFVLFVAVSILFLAGAVSCVRRTCCAESTDPSTIEITREANPPSYVEILRSTADERNKEDVPPSYQEAMASCSALPV
jgi:hypothetical protein